MSRLIRRIFDPGTRRSRCVRRTSDLNARLLVSALEDRSLPATFTVTTAADSGAGSLRDVIIQANATGAADTIQFSSSTAGGAIDFTSGPHAINLLTALPAIVNPVTITGPGANLLTVQRSTGGSVPAFRVFYISSANAFSATLSGMMISGGLAAGLTTTDANGGGLAVGMTQTVTLQNDVISGNIAEDAGGGVDVAVAGNLIVQNTTISGNTAGGSPTPYGRGTGGGIYFAAGGALTLDSSTVSGNSAGGGGGGVYLYGGNGLSGAWTIRNSTISGNTAAIGGGIYFVVPGGSNALTVQNSTIAFNTAIAGGSGGGIAQVFSGGTVTLTSTIVADNVASTGADVLTNPTTAMAPTFSLIQNQSGANLASGAGNLPAGTDPLLDPLGNYGGLTKTLRLQSGSPAIDHGSNPTAAQFDQRGAGFPRAVGQADIGAYEVLPPGTPTASATFANVTSAMPATCSFTITYMATASGATITAPGNIASGNIFVAGPNGYSQFAILDSVSPGGTAAVQTGTYHVTAPSIASGWAVSDYGTYTATLQDGEVVDSMGHAVTAGPLGTFQVLVPATFTVTNTLDDGSTGSLRWAISQANALAGAPVTIKFNLNPAVGTDFSTAQTINLTPATSAAPTTELAITNSVNIDASTAANVTINGGGLVMMPSIVSHRVFNIGGTSGMAVTLNNLTITGGFLNSALGAGIFDTAQSLTVINSVIEGNSIAGSAGSGAGIFVGTNDSLTVRNSTLTGNSTAGQGGGVYFSSGGSLLLDASTVSGNLATSTSGWGGGVAFSGSTTAGGFTVRNSTITGNFAGSSGGGIGLKYFLGTALIQDSTITGNAASQFVNSPQYSGGGGIGKFLGQTSGTIVLQNTIVAGNFTQRNLFRPDIAADTANSVTATNCLIGDVNSAVRLSPASANNLMGTDAAPLNPQLANLGNNGGPTLTMAPLVSSPVINHGVVISGITTDQRGAGRSAGVAPDIGAVETADANPVAAAGVLPDVTSTATSATFQFTVTYSATANINTATIGAGNVTITAPTGVTTPTVSVANVNNTNPLAVVVTYQFTAPGGAWTFADNGPYVVTANANQVADVNGHSATGDRVVGTFQARLPITVTNTNDTTTTTDPGYVGSLRWAIGLANANYGTADTIAFNNSTAGGAINFYDGTQHTVTLGGTELAVTDSTTFTGPGSSLLSISGNNASGVFALKGDGILNITLSGMTITGGNGVGPVDSGYGGGIVTNDDSLTLVDTRVTGNSATDSGGGICFVYPYGALTLRNSTVSGNTANGHVAIGAIFGGGGGIYIYAGGSLLVDSSTISGNTVTNGGAGGGIYFYGAPLPSAVGTFLTPDGLTVRDSTISGNSASGNGGGIVLNRLFGTLTVQNSTIAFNSAGGAGGGIDAAPTSTGGLAALILTSSIVAKNSDNGIGPDLSLVNHANSGGNVLGSAQSDHSLIGVGDTGFTLVNQGGTLSGTNASPLDPKLGVLAFNGGLTQTHALLPGSPAIDAGNNPISLTTDQRGLARGFGAAADIGAFEVQPPTVVSVQVNYGSAQRSEVRSIAVTFSEPVTFSSISSAFQLLHIQTNNNVTLGGAISTDSLGRTVVTLTFSGAETDPFSALNGGVPSLADGRYQLKILGGAVSGPDQIALDGTGTGIAGSNYISPADTDNGGPGQLGLYRLYGDATGNGHVDASDLGQFRTTYNAGSGNPLYLAFLDADNSGVVDSQDLGQFRLRFNASVFV